MTCGSASWSASWRLTGRRETVTPLPGLPELFHIGWVVRDCAAAQQELGARLGAGPFVSAGTEARFDQALVHGKPTPFSLRIAFGVLGGALIELLEPLDDRSPHAEFLDAHGEGMHHLAFLVPDFDEQLAAVRTARPEAELLIDGTEPETRSGGSTSTAARPTAR